jgi:hypothetical protein
MSNATKRPALSRNLVFAAIFVTLSLVTGSHAYRNMTVGTAAEMGPGFFPLMLSIVLGLLSLGVAFIATPEHITRLRIAPLRAIILVLGAPLLFALTIRSLGLVVAVALTVFLTSFASRFATLRNSLLLSAGFTIFCVVVFGYLLSLPIPLWGKLLVG